MAERFQWACSRGCGACSVKRIEFEFERVEDMSGNPLSSVTVPRLVSACCGASLFMWDMERDEEVDVDLEPIGDYAQIARATGAQS